MIKLMMKMITAGLILIGLTACGSSAYDYRKARLVDMVTVPLGTMVQARYANFSVTFDKIEQDLRCPVNARCTWDGVGIVNVTVKQGDKSQKVTLSTVNYEAYNQTESVFGKDIQLVALLPNKTAGATIASQTMIKLKID